MSSTLFLQTSLKYNRTILSDCYFTSPLKIAKPFYREDGYTEVMVLLAGPGMLKGDKYDIAFEVNENSKTLITAQSYQKLYDCAGGKTLQSVSVKVKDGAELCYIPHPIVPFNRNSFTSNMDVQLGENSKFFFADVVSCGRLGMGEKYKFAGFSSRVAVKVKNKTVFLDHTYLDPQAADFDALGFFEGFPCQGLVFIYGYDEFELPKNKHLDTAVSKCRQGYTVRILSRSADDAHKYSMQLWERVCKKQL